jgi:hypothetical protein
VLWSLRRFTKVPKEVVMERQTLQQRASECGLSMARLCREANVRYHRIAYGYPLLGDEERAVEAVLDKCAFRRKIHHDRAAV